MRSLECPPPRRARLQQLEHTVVVLVRRPLVTGEQPVRVRRDVRQRLPEQALEVLSEKGHALGGTVGRFVVNGTEARVQRVEHAGGRARRFDARTVRELVTLRRGDRVVRFPAHQRAVRRITVQQLGQERRAGAGHAEHSDGPCDRRARQLGVVVNPCGHSESVCERLGDDVRERGDAELRQLGFLAQRGDEPFEAFAVGVAAEVLEPGLGTRRCDERVRVHGAASSHPA